MFVARKWRILKDKKIFIAVLFSRSGRRFGRNYYVTSDQGRNVSFQNPSQKMTDFTDSPTEPI